MRTLPMVAASLLAIAAATASADNENKIRAKLTGYQEVPSVSSTATGRFVAEVAQDGMSFAYELTYSGLQGVITQSHIHFNQRALNGLIIIWLCQTATNPAPATVPPPPVCPANVANQVVEHSVRGTITSASVLPAAAQLLTAGEIEEAIEAMRAGAAYVNVHSSVVGSGEIRGQLRGHGMRKEDERDGGGHEGEHKH